MKKLISLTIVFALLLSFAACSIERPGPSQTTKPGQTQGSDTSPGSEASGDQTGSQSAALCVRYEDFSKARAAFGNYVTDNSVNHPIVSVKQTLALEYSLSTLEYILPLGYFGYSIYDSGQFNLAFEEMMLKALCGDDISYSHENGVYTLDNYKSGDNTIDIKATYDSAADSLSYEAYKNGDFVFLFEYSKIQGGYAAQFYFETIVEVQVGAAPITAFCNYRVIFQGNNGSCSRFDRQDNRPETIYRKTPDMGSFINGATHWITVTDGNFTGELGGSGF